MPNTRVLTVDRSRLMDGESHLIRSAQAGDREAIHRLFTPHNRSLYSLCHDMLGGHVADAEDAVQETYLRALRGLSTYRGDAGIRTWLFRIALNVCLDGRRARRPVEQLDTSIRSREPDPEATTLIKIQLEQALKSVPIRQRAVLLLKEEHGWSIGEIAKMMQWSERKVHNEIYKARRSLNAWLHETQREGDRR